MGERTYDPRREEYVDVDFHALKAMSPKAFGIELEEGDNDLTWLPKSQIDNVRQLTEQHELPEEQRTIQQLGIKRWLAIENGWVDEE